MPFDISYELINEGPKPFETDFKEHRGYNEREKVSDEQESSNLEEEETLKVAEEDWGGATDNLMTEDHLKRKQIQHG